MATQAEQLASLTATFEAFAKSQDKYNAKADGDRSDMMDAITKLTKSQDRLVEDMAEVKPVTDMVTGLHAKLIGATIVLGLIGAIAWGGVLFFKDAIIRFLTGG